MEKDLVGKRIRLMEMPNDPLPIPVGSTGRVTRVVTVQEAEHITVDWDCNRSLHLVSPPDKFVVIEED